MARPRPLHACLLAALAPAAAGCGSDPPTRSTDGTLTVRLTDYRIEPQRLVAPGGRLRITARNAGRLPHNLEIRGEGGRVRMRISTLLPGEAGTERLRLPPGRTWTLYCSIGNHEELGQHGELITR